MGSAKDLIVIRKPEAERMGSGIFIFRDDYSVFDWGVMPDEIPYKGAALCLMGAYCFEQAENRGIRTHYQGLVTPEGVEITTDRANEETDMMTVGLVRVIRPGFSNGVHDYSAFVPELANFLIPLEVIYRNGLPPGSSVFKRLERGDITPGDIGLDHYPSQGERFDVPIFDVSTKLEETDRYMKWSEAQKIAGLSDIEVEEIRRILFGVNDIITGVTNKASLVNEDGKIELGYDEERRPIVVDVIGTLDECRFTYNDFHVSKQAARDFYAKTPWKKEIDAAKERAKKEGLEDWRKFSSKPPEMNPELMKIISDMYTSTANAFLGREVFDSPPLGEVVASYRDWLDS